MCLNHGKDQCLFTITYSEYTWSCRSSWYSRFAMFEGIGWILIVRILGGDGSRVCLLFSIENWEVTTTRYQYLKLITYPVNSQIYLNEEHVPSNTQSMASSISSMSSYNVVDNWDTSGNAVVQGAWRAGPPPLARSPGFTPRSIRRDSSPFSNHSPNLSPRTNRRKCE
jgi:hypothetical protein